MANYGFAIDLRKCIGCHACTIACKAEHDIPIGVNRCWVKTVEKGTFPDTRRFFFPVLCNQCDAAPCVRICPTNALFKRRDGIVDLDGDACIGCRACMEACPYDQLFIDPNTHTAEKCNFCANRVENRLLPSCVIVCPTECRIFGDLDDPSSAVSQFARNLPVTVRKPEKGTVPKVFYMSAEESAIRPEIAARPFMFREGQVLLRPPGAVEEDAADPGHPRVDYDVPHPRPWGVHMALYLLTKGIATGALLLAAVLWLLGFREGLTTLVAPAVAVLFVTITAAVLVADLERPERFFYILTRPNWRSWLARGTYILVAFGLVAALWLAAGWLGSVAALEWLALPAIGIAVLATSYTAFLFAQGLARDLWQGPYAGIDLIAQSVIEGSAVLLVLAPWTTPGTSPDLYSALNAALVAGVALHLLLLVFEHLTPSPTRHHELAVRSIVRGVYARVYWFGAVLIGGVLPIVALGILSLNGGAPPWWTAVIAVTALAGAFAWEYVWVHAGQAVPNS
ncbi:MAG TPA: NrfD/PsrC family molybdoenzyme membrane anchor subunit [Vicinamibacterales bacterium]|nr:NrfD/PsrC family molybdoenzyme membrane anchor subunit [Vicinamibacterales bacterium]